MIRKALLSIFISFCFIQLSFSYELNDSDQKIVASFAYNLNNKASLLSDNEKLNVKVKLTAAITRMKIKYKNNKRIYNILNEIATELKYSKINWTTYTDKEYGFTVSYPRQAYMKTKCGENTIDELVSLKMFKKDNTFVIGYSKRVDIGNYKYSPYNVDDCKLVDNNYDDFINNNVWGNGATGIDLVIYNAESKEKFFNQLYKPMCMIESTEKFMNNNNVELIHVITKPEIVKCIDNETCPENERFGCVNYTNNIFDKINKKGITIRYSGADYYIQKYPTYKETMEKGAYDSEITESFKFIN